MDRNELRRLAEAAALGPWWTSDKLKCHPDLELSDDTAYIAAASPEVVMKLLDSIEVLEGWYATASGQRNTAEAERDQLRAEVALQKAWAQQMALADVEHLREVLGKIAEFGPAVTHGWAVHVREMARNALKAR